MFKVVFYRSLYTIIHLFIQFFILETNYWSAKSIVDIISSLLENTEDKNQLTNTYFKTDFALQNMLGSTLGKKRGTFE